MNPALLAFGLLALLCVGSVAPGLLIVRRLRWSPMEKLCGAVASSLVITYLASLVLFCCGAGPIAYLAVSGVFDIALCFGVAQLVGFLRNCRTRRALMGFGILLIWYFIHLAMARQLAGGGWGGDWNEHFDRTRFFVHELPSDYLFLNRYMLPARPPMMNLLAAFYCRQVETTFPAHSLVFLFLNALAFLPCCLLLGRLSRRGARYTPVLVALFMLNPSIVQNATWGWTKALCAGFIILAVCYYLRGLEARDMSRIAAAALCLAAAILVHYSAIPFALAIGIHYAVMLGKGRRRGAEAIKSGVLAVALLATWFGWSIWKYGAIVTFFANTSIAGTAPESVLQTINKVIYNCFTTIVPHPLHPIGPVWFEPIKSISDIRDYFFLMTQTTLIMMIGSVSGIAAVVWLALFFIRKDRRLADERHFWIVFIGIGFLLGVAVNPMREQFGCAHVTLQTLGLMGVTLVASRLPGLGRPGFFAIYLGLIVDYAMGILLNFRCRTRIFPAVGDPSAWLQKLLDNQQGLDGQQYGVKLLLNVRFWGDHLAAISGALTVMSIVGAWAALAALILMRRSKERVR